MAVHIRLRRTGTKRKPAYRVVVADSRAARDGQFIEVIGHYNPLTKPPTIKIEVEKAHAWINKGAQPSNTVRNLLARARARRGSRQGLGIAGDGSAARGDRRGAAALRAAAARSRCARSPTGRASGSGAARVHAVGAPGGPARAVPHRLLPLRGRDRASPDGRACDSPEAARRLCGRLLAVSREEALPARGGQLLPVAARGRAWSRRATGGRWARFVGVEPGGAGALGGGRRHQRERLIPAVAEIVVEVSVAERRIVIDPPEGLLDL